MTNAMGDNSQRDPTPPLGSSIGRPVLLQRLRDATNHKLTTIIAPAGFGKSTLIKQLKAQCADERIAIVDMEQPHDGASGVVAGLSRALGALESIEFGEKADVDLLGRPVQAGEASRAQLQEQLIASSPGVIVIDNVDDLVASSGLVDLALAVAESPSTLRFVLAGRADPLLMRRFSALDIGVTFDQKDLAFSSDEVRVMLQSIVGETPDELSVEDILVRTAGWPAGVHLAALSCRDRRNQAPNDLQFANDVPFVADYLYHNAFVGLSTRMRRFLLRVAIVSDLTPSLCNALTGDADAAQMLSQMEKKRLFIERMDSDGPTFHLHPLFREMLLQVLRISQPGLERELLCIASDWHRSHNDLEAAGLCLVAAEEWARLLALVGEASATLFIQGRAKVALNLLKAIPVALRVSWPELLLAEAILETMVGATLAAECSLEALLRLGPLTDGEKTTVCALRAAWVEHHAPLDAVLIDADEVLNALPRLTSTDLPSPAGLMGLDSLHSIALIAKGKALWLQGQTAPAREALQSAISQTSVSDWFLINALGMLGVIEAEDGHLCDAHRLAKRALDVASIANVLDHAATGPAWLALACVYRERGALEQAGRLLAQAEVVFAATEASTMLTLHAVEAARLDLATSNARHGLQRLESFLLSGHARTPPRIFRQARAAEARLWLAAGETDVATRIVDHAMSASDNDLRSVAIQIALEKRDVALAHELLVAWIDDGRTRSRLERDLMTAVTQDIAGESGNARRHAIELVNGAKTEGHVSIFVDRGEDARRLLRVALRSDRALHLDGILDEALDGAGAEHSWIGNASENGELPFFTQRQLLVLSYLPSSLSNAEIAAQLYISLNTVKTHLRTIYRGLGVSDRHTAVTRATEYGMV